MFAIHRKLIVCCLRREHDRSSFHALQLVDRVRQSVAREDWRVGTGYTIRYTGWKGHQLRVLKQRSVV